ncbi:hypothetical protein BC829DRAFT_397429 [Chytridium lagenaria]|nr:hypothetical protein BC829DRAFT_397429 [Chytridium lagenaria]
MPLDQQHLKEVTLKVASDLCLFHDLTVFLERPSSIESFEIDMDHSGVHFSPHIIKFFEWLTLHQPPNLKSLKLTNVGLSTAGYSLDVVQMAYQEARRCYAALEMFASTSKFLKVLHLYTIEITDEERAVTDRIRNAREKNGLGDLHICIKYRRS